jgi:hypothetical protein
MQKEAAVAFQGTNPSIRIEELSKSQNARRVGENQEKPWSVGIQVEILSGNVPNMKQTEMLATQT